MRGLLVAGFCCVLALFASGCILLQGEVKECTEDAQCQASDPGVCATDGVTYACAALAQCSGATVDASGEACSMCPELFSCNLQCTNGYKVDENGCDTCACKVECEPLNDCGIFCDGDRARDSDGCEICECEGQGSSAECPPAPRCDDGLLECELDPVTDCEVCECEPIACPAIACQEFPHACLEYERDDSGCSTCECIDYMCEPLTCDLACDEFETDEYGCDVCECVERNDCPSLDACNKSCEIYAEDADGCELCVCAGRVDCERNEQCALDELCVVIPNCCDPEIETCRPLQPVCERTCLPAPRQCEGADTNCMQGTTCRVVPRADCCKPDETCTDDKPACPMFCLPEP